MIATIETRDENEPVSLNIRNIPLGLRRKFKSWCAMRGLKMETFTVDIIRKLVDGELAKDEVRDLVLSSEKE